MDLHIESPRKHGAPVPQPSATARRRSSGDRSEDGELVQTTFPLTELIDAQTQVLPLTVERYHELIEMGFLPEGEPYELLYGVLVRKDRSAAGENPMTVGDEHIWVVKRLAKLSRNLERMGCHMQTQQPLTLPPYDEPEPDGAIIAGTEDDYRTRKPGAKDTLCVIEVSESSLRRDRTVKMRIYADAGIPQYVIINLLDRLVEVYSEPLAGKGRYGQSVTLRPNQKITFPAARGRQLVVPVRRLLP